MDDFQHEGRLQRLEELILRATGGAGPSTFGASAVVWRPGGVTSNNVFATWAEAVAAVAQMNGAIMIVLDNSLAAAVIPAGDWDLRPPGVNGPVAIVDGTKTGFGPFITIANAPVTIHGLTGLRDVSIDNQSTVDVITVTAASIVLFFMEGGAAIYQNPLSGGAAFFKVVSGGMALYMRDFSFVSTLGGGTNAIQTTGALQINLHIEDFSAFDTSQLLAAAAQTVFVSAESSPGIPPYATQAGAPTTFPNGMRVKGSSAIVVGTGKTAVIPAFMGAATRILVSLKTPSGDALTIKYAAISADRVNGFPGSFQISALAAAGDGVVNGVDVSTVDWEVLN